MPTFTEIAAAFDAKLAASGVTTRLFSVQNHDTSTYQHNNNCWASGVNVSCHSVWNSANANKWNATAINDHTVAMASHIALGVGTELRFVDSGSGVHTNYITKTTQVSSYANDITLGQLKYRLPSGIVPCSIYSGSDYPNNVQMPIFGIGPSGDAVVYGLSRLVTADTYVYARRPTDSNRAKFYGDMSSQSDGNSGSPFFMLIDNAPHLLYTVHGASSNSTEGPYYKYSASSVSGAIVPDVTVTSAKCVDHDGWIHVSFSSPIIYCGDEYVSHPENIIVTDADGEKTCASCYADNDDQLWIYLLEGVYFRGGTVSVNLGTKAQDNFEFVSKGILAKTPTTFNVEEEV